MKTAIELAMERSDSIVKSRRAYDLERQVPVIELSGGYVHIIDWCEGSEGWPESVVFPAEHLDYVIKALLELKSTIPPVDCPRPVIIEQDIPLMAQRLTSALTD